ncbi:alpha-ketoglutarate-dependent dioxygenase AlkB [Pedobacter sp. LMG 31464]|uniref:Alpha-ketoglutarate-dependent dioxygenase AlkB n=1 Tax=Pedobacter planticolens TaxID=2679964 RepID=A0A923E3H8_9SPHI|nr:alpha-ketoglutarate-dependent dioxygenase AlkB [Pedobacter planticolens]MBB2146829.1 alpha-ketoglutarate-dependent dioxygenase AlkB [Pedobacter planticolens]
MAQIDIFGSYNNVGIQKITDGEYNFEPNFYNKNEADRLYNVLLQNVSWKQESMNIYGKKINLPRLTAWYGDTEKYYSFSGIHLQPLPWLPELSKIKEKIQQFANAEFNSVLLNLYRNGNDSISWHTDAESELGINPIIGSVNFGETRKFQLRHKRTNEKIEIDLNHGSGLVMQGSLQHHWQHQVPKISRPAEQRINLTFRFIKTL